MAQSIHDIIRGPHYPLEHRYAGTVPWLGAVTRVFGGNETGLYLVSLAKDPESRECALAHHPLHRDRLRHWLLVRPELRLGGARPSVDELSEHLSKWWLPDEHVLYVGRTQVSLARRVHDYYRTLLGAAKPHAGGSWLKTLGCLDQLYVHLFVGDGSSACEHMALLNFHHGLSATTSERLPEALDRLPFANLQWADGPTKNHALTGMYGTV